jgi:enoyl-CoA hydratase/3-hydroxyacyl-CoA dehydrogenase
MAKIMVIGAGTMGSGIATVFAMNNYEVTLVDVNNEILNRALNKIKWSMESLYKRGKLKTKPEKLLENIHTDTDIKNIKEDMDLIIEAVVEDSKLKRNIFNYLDSRFDRSILATNTSSIPIDEISKDVKGKERVVGMHFFNPPTLINLVEIIPSSYTSKDTIEKVRGISKSIGMETILVKKDIPGFVVNRINLKIFDNVLSMAEEGINISEIDSVARYRLMLPMGFFELFDFIGLDVLKNVMDEIRSRGFEISEHRILNDLINKGKLGMKSGEGFYKYERSYSRARIKRRDIFTIDPLKIISPGINEASYIISNGIATIEDVEKGQKIGMGYSKGILELADGYGLDEVVKTLNSMGLKPDKMLQNLVDEGKYGIKSGYGFYQWAYKRKEMYGLIYEKRSNHAYITLNRPEKMNSLNKKTWDSLRSSMEMAIEDNVKCIFITGEGRAFCTGDDINEMYSLSSMDESKEFFKHVEDAFNSILNIEIPVIALVNGYAYGGGAEMLLIFDLVISSENAEIAFSESKIGALPPIATTVGLNTIGRKIIRFTLTGEAIDPIDAREMGIVDIVVPDNQLQRAYYEYSRIFDNIQEDTLRNIKKIINLGKKSENTRISLDELIKISMEESFKEGSRRFIEK